jgi:hypothetical protein
MKAKRYRRVLAVDIGGSHVKMRVFGRREMRQFDSSPLEADYVVIGGGNARKLKRLPKNARLGNNDFAFLGGFRMWHHATAKGLRRSIVIP